MPTTRRCTILHTDYDVTGDQLSEELQLTYQTERLTGVFGLYYFEQTSDDIVTVDLNPPPPGVQRDSDNNKVDNPSWAAFTQWTFKFTDMFAVTVGGRYTEDKKDSFPTSSTSRPRTYKQVPVQLVQRDLQLVHAVRLVPVEWNESAMTYLSYSEGFKGGGWNSHFNAVLTPAQQAALHPFAPEEAQTIELGTKLDLAGNTLRLNARGIHAPTTPTCSSRIADPRRRALAPFITNAGETSIDGAEVELTWAADGQISTSTPASVISTPPSTPLEHSAGRAAAGSGGRKLPAVCAGMAGALGHRRTPPMPAASKSCRASTRRSSRDFLRRHRHRRDRAAR